MESDDSTAVKSSTPSRVDTPSSMVESSLNSTTEHNGPPCYSICFDNVNQKVTVRHQTRDNKNKMFNMVQSYAAMDRIQTLHLSDEMPTPDDILEIPLQSYLPSEMDEIELRSEMSTMISIILFKYIPVFDGLNETVIWHIKHKFSTESSKKSMLVPLGVLDKDESKVSDTIDIMENYHQYVPIKPNDKPLTIPLHADGLSCERGNDAQSARINASSQWDQLQGFVLNIQEWHKRCLLLQDIYDILYKTSSGREKGTLHYLKNYFNHRSVTTNTKESFNFNEEFLEFCTEGYIVLAAMSIMNMNDIKDIPEDFPVDKTEQEKYMNSICSKLLDMIYLSSQPTVQKIMDEATEGGDMQEEYCHCRRHISGSTMVFCSGKNCQHVWYHLDCVDLEEADVPEGKWFCSDVCKFDKATKRSKKRSSISETLIDKKQNYAILLMWSGLQQIVRKDALRENDGQRIISHWKFDMLNFFQNHHPKYFLVGHRLLSAVIGAVSPRLQQTLTWNRTINPNGGQGRNISMDLQMEYFNKEYKESVKDAAGHLTTATVERHSQMVGVGKILRNIYVHQVSELSRNPVHGHDKTDRSKDINEFVSLMFNEKIFQSHPGRSHSSFPSIDINIYKDIVPKGLKSRLSRLRAEMSKRRKVINKKQEV